MSQERENFAFKSYKRKHFPAASYQPCSNVVSLRLSFGVPFILLWPFYGALKWIRSAFDKGLKVITCTTEPQLVTKDNLINV